MAKTKYTETESQRRSAIEYLIDNPGAFARDILAQLGWRSSTGIKRLKKMLEMNEIRREELEKPGTDTSKRVARIFKYWAVVESPMSIDEVRLHRKRKKQLAKEEQARKEEEERVRSIGRYVHNNPNRLAIKNQGGQGAVRPFMCSPISDLD